MAEACRELVDAIDRHAPAVRMLVSERWLGTPMLRERVRALLARPGLAPFPEIA